MHTELHPQLAGDKEAEEAKAIIQACVHCGFCTATCPTYQHFHDERVHHSNVCFFFQELHSLEAVSLLSNRVPYAPGSP